MIRIIDMIKILGFMGLIPFIALPIMAYLAQDSSPPFAGYHALVAIHLMYVFLIYSAIIAVFMAGAIWGRTVEQPSPRWVPLLFSNVLALFVLFLALFVTDSALLLIAGLILAHCMNLLFEPFCSPQEDKRLQDDKTSYLKLRTILTTVVISSHLAFAFIIYSL
ncbi:DUF3429 domain-containing protein [Vibrio renipiscarius]|nr:DUF3429 domain-containing protein [Vibrio renipiscarius]